MAYGLIELLEALVIPRPPQVLRRFCSPALIQDAFERHQMPGIDRAFRYFELAGSVTLELCRFKRGAAAVAASSLPHRLLFSKEASSLLASASWTLDLATSGDAGQPYIHAQMAGLAALGRCLATLDPGSLPRERVAKTILKWSRTRPVPTQAPPQLIHAARALCSLAGYCLAPRGKQQPVTPPVPCTYVMERWTGLQGPAGARAWAASCDWCCQRTTPQLPLTPCPHCNANLYCSGSCRLADWAAGGHCDECVSI